MNITDVRVMRTMMAAIRRLQNMPCEELMTFAKENDAPYDLVGKQRQIFRWRSAKRWDSGQ